MNRTGVSELTDVKARSPVQQLDDMTDIRLRSRRKLLKSRHDEKYDGFPREVLSISQQEVDQL